MFGMWNYCSDIIFNKKNVSNFLLLQDKHWTHMWNVVLIALCGGTGFTGHWVQPFGNGSTRFVQQICCLIIGLMSHKLYVAVNPVAL